MSFVHPLFLWALTALAIPVIIHLFNFRRTKKIYFSNNRLLEQIREVSSKKRKLRDLLILFSRILFLLFLVLAFSQPFLPSKENMGSGKKIVLYLDNSPSMSVPMPDRSRALDHAVAYARSVVQVFPSDTRYIVLTNDFSSNLNFKSARETVEHLAAVRLSSESRSFQDVVRKISKDSSADLFYISDFQRSSAGDLVFDDSLRRIGLVPVQPERKRNVFVDSAAFENPYLVTGEKARLTVWLRNDSREEIEQLNVRLTSGKTLASMTTVTIPPLGLTSVEMDVSVSDRSVPMKISIQDFPVVYDNEFYVAALPMSRLEVLHLYDGKFNPYISEVFGNTSIFKVRSQSVRNMSYNNLGEADLMVLEGVNGTVPGIERHLKDYPDQRVLLIPADEPDEVFISATTGVQIQRLKNSVRSQLAVPSFRDPFFENVLENNGNDLRMPEVAPLIRWNNDRSALLQFRDGSPLLSRFGRFFLMASSLTPSKNELVMHALFVPVMYRIAASSRSGQLKPYHFLTENLIALPLDSVSTEVPVRLIGPTEAVPGQRTADGKILIDLPGSQLAPGHYAAVRNQDTLALLAFNYGQKESEMDYFDVEELVKMADGSKNVNVFKGGTAEAFSKGIKERYLGVPLWKYCLILSLLFLFAEVLLLRLFNTPSIFQRQAVKPST